MAQDPLDELQERPGFLIRRAHQMSVSIFLEATGPLRATPTQYGMLVLLSARSDVDQITVARLLGLDRSTTSMVVKALETEGLVVRGANRQDRRRKTLGLTDAGRAALAELEGPAAQAADTLLAPLEPAERIELLRLLEKLTKGLNETSRVPIVQL